PKEIGHAEHRSFHGGRSDQRPTDRGDATQHPEAERRARLLRCGGRRLGLRTYRGSREGEHPHGADAMNINPVLKERIKRILPKVGYPLFYLFSLLVFLSWTFPFDTLKERIVATFNAQQRSVASSPQELFIDELDSSFVTGIKAKGVRLVQASSDPEKPPVESRIDEARARISL